MAERTNALVLKTRGGKTPVGSNPTSPAAQNRVPNRFQRSFAMNILKIVKIMETFAFGLCTLWVPPRDGGGERKLFGKRSKEGGLDEEGDIPGYGRSPAHAGTGARRVGAGYHHDDGRVHHDGW